MKNVLIVAAYARVQRAYDRHLRIWKRHGLPLVVFTELQSPVDGRGERVVALPYCGKHGPASRTRIVGILDWFSASEFDGAMICEYDAFALDKEINVPNGLHGSVARNDEPLRFYAPRYVGCPWRLDRSSARAMFSVAEKYPDLIEDCADDRLISALAFVAGVPILSNGRNNSWFVNTITSGMFDQVAEALRNGVTFWHGIKDEATLNLFTDYIQ